jgi:hypothetical protein
MDAMMSSTVRWFRAHALELVTVAALAALYLGVANTARLDAHSSVQVTPPSSIVDSALTVEFDPALADSTVTSTHERTLARPPVLNRTDGATVPAAAAAHMATFERSLARLRDLNASGDPTVDVGVFPERPVGHRTGPY